MKWIIERMNRETREWWTGSGWSESDTDAHWYDEEPDEMAETGDDTALAVDFDDGYIEDAMDIQRGVSDEGC